MIKSNQPRHRIKWSFNDSNLKKKNKQKKKKTGGGREKRSEEEEDGWEEGRHITSCRSLDDACANDDNDDEVEVDVGRDGDGETIDRVRRLAS